ncbi:MAG TPA: hypothetical protein PLK73_00825 [Candidatus Omnitrophota bacterium]|nr:hypothetical protein [Candidatus Omnitrophota bacterium]
MRSEIPRSENMIPETRNTVKIFLLTVFVICFLWAEVQAETPFKVTVKPDQSSVKPGMMFLVNAGVTNRTENTVILQVPSCAFDKLWELDGEHIRIQPWTCHQDTTERAEISPGESYEKNLILYASDVNQPGPVTFRMGFKHVLENGDEMEPVWSDPVMIQVLIPEGPLKESALPGERARPISQSPAGVEISEVMPDEISEDEVFGIEGESPASQHRDESFNVPDMDPAQSGV